MFCRKMFGYCSVKFLRLCLHRAGLLTSRLAWACMFGLAGDAANATDEFHTPPKPPHEYTWLLRLTDWSDVVAIRDAAKRSGLVPVMIRQSDLARVRNGDGTEALLPIARSGGREVIEVVRRPSLALILAPDHRGFFRSTPLSDHGDDFVSIIRWSGTGQSFSYEIIGSALDWDSLSAERAERYRQGLREARKYRAAGITHSSEPRQLRDPDGNRNFVRVELEEGTLLLTLSVTKGLLRPITIDRLGVVRLCAEGWQGDAGRLLDSEGCTELKLQNLDQSVQEQLQALTRQ